MALTPLAFRRLTKELAQLQQSPPEGIRVVIPEDDVLDVAGWVEGPVGTPYEGGYFQIRFQFSHEFPAAPPKCWFITRIFHPNVAPTTGEICVNTLKKDWKKEYGVGYILVTVKCLLIYPNPESALHEEAGKLLLEQYDSYARHARLMTNIHAKSRPAEFSPVVGTSALLPPSHNRPGSLSRENSPVTLMPPHLNNPSNGLALLGLKDSVSARSQSPDPISPSYVPFPTLPLQTSATNNVNLVGPGSPAPSSASELETMDDGRSPNKKRTVSSAMGKGASSAHVSAPQTKKVTGTTANAGKKRGLRRL